MLNNNESNNTPSWDFLSSFRVVVTNIIQYITNFFTKPADPIPPINPNAPTETTQYNLLPPAVDVETTAYQIKTPVELHCEIGFDSFG